MVAIAENEAFRRDLVRRLEQEKRQTEHAMAELETKKADLDEKLARAQVKLDHFTCAPCFYLRNSTTALIPTPSRDDNDHFICPLCGAETVVAP